MRSRLPGYVACGSHGNNGYGADKIALDCRECVRLPRRKSDGEYVGDLRVLVGLERDVQLVAVGVQLAFEVVA